MVSNGDFEQTTSALFVCDFQKHYSPLIENQYNYILINNQTLIKVCEELNIPIIFTLHKGYGELDQLLGSERHKVFEKTKYSMWDNNLSKHVRELYPNLKSVLLTGFELHVCLYQTALDLVKNGYEVHIIMDASSSVNAIENNMAIDRIKQISGTFLLSTEMTILQLIKDDTHPNSEIVIKLNSDRLDALLNEKNRPIIN